MTISRRAFVLGGAGAMVLVGAGGVGLVEAGALPGRTKLDNLLGWDGGGGTVPSIEPGPMVSGSFRSAARRTTVGYTIVRPPGRTGRMPVAVSPAIFADYASSSAGSFDSEADFRTNDPRNFPDKLKDIAVLIDCGTDDPFAGQAEQMRNLVRPTPAGGMSRGAHTDRYMTRVAPEQMAFLGEQLHSG